MLSYNFRIYGCFVLYLQNIKFIGYCMYWRFLNWWEFKNGIFFVTLYFQNYV